VSGWRRAGLSVILAIHDRQIAEHGGADGILNLGLIESAIAKPRNLAAYGTPDAADLAAAYACGIARNHGFADGNKRTAWIAARLFLADNGYKLRFEPLEAVKLMQAAAGGEQGEKELAAWFRQRMAR
jgi:death-on-curing protein